MDRGGEALQSMCLQPPTTWACVNALNTSLHLDASPVRYSNYSFIPAVLLPRRRTTYLLVQEQDIVGREIQGLAPNDLR